MKEDLKKYVISIDQGTSSTKCILMDRQGEIIHRISKKVTPIRRVGSYVEYDAEKIAEDVAEGIRELVTFVLAKEVACIGLSVQTGAFVLWRASTGRPVCPLISWQDARGKEALAWMDEETKKKLKPFRSSFSGTSIASKLYWMKKKRKEFEELAEAEDLRFGTVDSYLIHYLTKGQVHACNCCNASISRMYDMEAERFNIPLLEALGLPMSMMPEVLDDDGSYGTFAVSEETAIPIAGVMGDSAAALFGQGCFDEGKVKVTYGTGASFLMNIGKKAVSAPKGIVLNIVWKTEKEKIYAWEGTVYYAGAALERAGNKFGIPILYDGSDQDVVRMAESAGENGGVYFIPPLCVFGSRKAKEEGGLIARYTGVGEADALNAESRTEKEADMYAAEGDTEISRVQILRAAMESVGYQIRDIAELLAKEGWPLPERIVADGGGALNEFLMQFQADILNCEICLSSAEDASALGAAFMAGLGTGFWENTESLQGILRQKQKVYRPGMCEQKRKKNYEGWRYAVEHNTEPVG